MLRIHDIKAAKKDRERSAKAQGAKKGSNKIPVYAKNRLFRVHGRDRRPLREVQRAKGVILRQGRRVRLLPGGGGEKLTKHELSQLYYLNREIERDKRRLEELRTAASGAAQKITGMPHVQAVTDKVGNYSAEIADLKSIIELNIQKCFYELNRLNRFIQRVDDSQMRQILTLRYINGLSWQKVAFGIGEYDESLVRKKHDRFLKASEHE